MMSSNNKADDEPPAKRRLLGPSNRVVLDVGGTKFIAAASTLTSSSTYFASLLSDHWIESNDGDELFIDQDPVAFGKLLAYMRRGMIKVEDIDTVLLVLAEFLGIEHLLLAVKIRWYRNIGKGPVVSSDEEIAAVFDEEHGGILKAISTGLFPCFTKRDDANADKDYAIFTTSWADGEEHSSWSVFELVNGKRGPDRFRMSVLGALNGLYERGFTLPEVQIHHNLDDDHSFTFSRFRHSVINSDATDIFIPTEDESERLKKSSHVKQFALYIRDIAESTKTILAPAEFDDDDQDPFCDIVRISNENDEFHDRDEVEFWLERNQFVTHEKEIEELPFFRSYIKATKGDEHPSEIGCAIFSRMIPVASIPITRLLP